jgi:tetrahydromethanopterin S-methyltransferase subunit E
MIWAAIIRAVIAVVKLVAALGMTIIPAATRGSMTIVVLLGATLARAIHGAFIATPTLMRIESGCRFAAFIAFHSHAAVVIAVFS